MLFFLHGNEKWAFQLFLLPVKESLSVNLTKKTQFLYLVRAYHKKKILPLWHLSKENLRNNR